MGAPPSGLHFLLLHRWTALNHINAFHLWVNSQRVREGCSRRLSCFWAVCPLHGSAGWVCVCVCWFWMYVGGLNLLQHFMNKNRAWRYSWTGLKERWARRTKEKSLRRTLICVSSMSGASPEKSCGGLGFMKGRVSFRTCLTCFEDAPEFHCVKSEICFPYFPTH